MLVSAASQKLDLRVRRRSERRVPAFCACAAAARLPEILHDFLGTASGPAIGGPLSAASGFSTSEAPPPRDFALAVASAEPRRKERRGSPFLARPSAIVTASPLTGDIGSDAVGRKCFGRNLFVRACIELSHIKWLGWHRKGAIGSLRFELRICDHGDRRRSSSAEVQKAKAARGTQWLDTHQCRRRAAPLGSVR